LYVSYYSILYWLNLGFIVCLIIYKLLNNNVSWVFVFKEFAIAMIIVSIIAIVLPEILYKLHRVNTTKGELIISKMITISVLIIILILGDAYTNVYGIKNIKTTYGTTIYFDDSTQLVSDSTNYFIGKTQNFIFFYHEKAKTTDVYPMDRVKELSFKDNEK
jgi:dipeptide/tripeptide permease